MVEEMKKTDQTAGRARRAEELPPAGQTEIKAKKYPDGKIRCPYMPENDELYLKYHDEEWCVPEHDDRKLYEMFVLELFQAGLSWRTLLHKRENFRAAYDGFDVRKVAAYDEEKIDQLMQDSGIIRSRPKIEASVSNSRIFLQIQDEYGSFDRYIWSFTAGEPVYVLLGVTKNELSDRVTADLKKRGVKYAGSVTIFSYLQAVGVINSHLPECFCSRK